MTELVVLASAAGEPIGTAPKAEVHTTDTPLMVDDGEDTGSVDEIQSSRDGAKVGIRVAC